MLDRDENFAERQVLGFIQTFIVKSRRDRYYELISKGCSHKKSLDRLNHKLAGDLQAVVEHDDPPVGVDLTQAAYILSDSSGFEEAVMPLSEAITLQEQSYFGALIITDGGKLARMRSESPSKAKWLYR